MLCPSCQTENPDHAKLCMECGHRFVPLASHSESKAAPDEAPVAVQSVAAAPDHHESGQTGGTTETAPVSAQSPPPKVGNPGSGRCVSRRKVVMVSAILLPLCIAIVAISYIGLRPSATKPEEENFDQDFPLVESLASPSVSSSRGEAKAEARGTVEISSFREYGALALSPVVRVDADTAVANSGGSVTIPLNRHFPEGNDDRVYVAVDVDGVWLPLAARPEIKPGKSPTVTIKTNHFSSFAVFYRFKSYGMHLVRGKEGAMRRLVFVHGLDSSPATWNPLINALGKERDSETAFHTFSYRNDQPISTSAREFAAALDQLLAGEIPCICHIIAHSMGGLVTRAALPLLKARTFDQVTSIDFIATPHAGSMLARDRYVAELVSAAASPVAAAFLWQDGVGEAALDLVPDSSFLRELNDPRGLAASRISQVSYRNHHGTKSLLPWSARLPLPDELRDGRGDGAVSISSAIALGEAGGRISFGSGEIADELRREFSRSERYTTRIEPDDVEFYATHLSVHSRPELADVLLSIIGMIREYESKDQLAGDLLRAAAWRPHGRSRLSDPYARFYLLNGWWFAVCRSIMSGQWRPAETTDLTRLFVPGNASFGRPWYAWHALQLLSGKWEDDWWRKRTQSSDFVDDFKRSDLTWQFAELEPTQYDTVGKISVPPHLRKVWKFRSIRALTAEGRPVLATNRPGNHLDRVYYDNSGRPCHRTDNDYELEISVIGSLLEIDGKWCVFPSH
jgi:pimeloyl-ACP methyl ester carboxylesterase